MNTSRRRAILSGIGLGAAGLTILPATAAPAFARANHSPNLPHGGWVDLGDTAEHDHTAQLQTIIDRHAQNASPVCLPPGRFNIANLELRPGTKLIGAAGLTYLNYRGGSFFIKAEKSADLFFQDIIFDGQHLALDGDQATGLVTLNQCADLVIERCTFKNSSINALSLEMSSGRVETTSIKSVAQTALFSNNAQGLAIRGNEIDACGNNAIQVWRDSAGDDGTLVQNNRITNVLANSGGSGQNGNAINVYRADNVLVSGNSISDCAYSAVRGNAASNFQVTSNTCHRLGEVALYAEFAFEGVQFANNIITDAATGISVTNFNEGGRLASVTGNLIRNLKRREFEPVDKRGVGISVEADSVVANNVIEQAPSAGLSLGWGRYRRNIIAAQNIIREAGVGILVSSGVTGGPIHITDNLLSNIKSGAIRRGQHDMPVGSDPSLDQPFVLADGISCSGNIVS